MTQPQGCGPPVDRLRTSLLSQAGSQALRLVLAIAISGWLARYLGPAALGKLSYVAALVGVFGPLGSLGIRGSLAALLCSNQPLEGLVSTALCVELIGTLMLSLVLLPWAVLAGDPVIAGLIGCGVIANCFNSSEVFEVELLNLQRGRSVARVDALQALIGSCLTAAALLAQAPLLVFGGIVAVQSAIKAILLAPSAKVASLKRFVSDVKMETATALLKRGLPLLLAGFSVMLYMKSDLVMIQWLSGSANVGQYSTAVRVAESLYFLPVVLSQTYLPRIGPDHDLEQSAVSLIKFYRLSWLLGVGLMLASMLILPALIPLVFGAQYESAKQALFYLGPAAFAVATGSASGAWLTVHGHQSIVAQRSFFGAIANIILNLVLIPRRGIEGAAIATSISYLLSVYAICLIRREIRANTLKLLLPL